MMRVTTSSTRHIWWSFPRWPVMTVILSFDLLGDAWRDWLDPRTRSQMAAQEFSR